MNDVLGLKPKKADYTAYRYEETIGVDCSDKTDRPCITFMTSNNGIYNPIFGAVAWNNFNLEANLFAKTPKTTWYGQSALEKIVGDNTEKCDPWGNLAQARVYAVD